MSIENLIVAISENDTALVEECFKSLIAEKISAKLHELKENIMSEKTDVDDEDDEDDENDSNNDIGKGKKDSIEVKEGYDPKDPYAKGTVTINKPGHRHHGAIASVFYRHPDGRVNVQLRSSIRKGDIENYTLKPGEFTENQGK